MAFGFRGANAQRLIANRAIDTLPPELQTFFGGNRDFILRHAYRIH